MNANTCKSFAALSLGRVSRFVKDVVKRKTGSLHNIYFEDSCACWGKSTPQIRMIVSKHCA